MHDRLVMKTDNGTGEFRDTNNLDKVFTYLAMCLSAMPK